MLTVELSNVFALQKVAFVWVLSGCVLHFRGEADERETLCRL